MEKSQNNITLKFTIGLSLITILILSIQICILNSFNNNKIEFEVTRFSLIFSVLVLPLVGLSIVTKLCCKKRDINHSHLLTKVFIISIILSIFSALYLGFRFGMFGNVTEGVLVISNGSADIISNDIIKSYEGVPLKSFILIDNIKFILQALIASTLYISILIITFVRHWINQNLSINNEDSIKQVKQISIIILAIIILKVLVSIGIGTIKGNIQVPITIRLDAQVTELEKSKIENKLKEIDEIINYKYIDSSETSNELKEWFNETFDNMSYDDYKHIFYSKNLEKFYLKVNNKNVDFIKKELENLDGVKEIQGMSF